MMQALDHQAKELPPGTLDYLSMAPSGYFKRQIHACFWFEQTGLDQAIDALGADHIMFETDYPHPTCTYPNGLDIAAEALRHIQEPDVRRKLMGGNAAQLYRIDLPTRLISGIKSTTSSLSGTFQPLRQKAFAPTNADASSGPWSRPQCRRLQKERPRAMPWSTVIRRVAKG